MITKHAVKLMQEIEDSGAGRMTSDRIQQAIDAAIAEKEAEIEWLEKQLAEWHDIINETDYALISQLADKLIHNEKINKLFTTVNATLDGVEYVFLFTMELREPERKSQYRLLCPDEIIEAGDEVIEFDTETWDKGFYFSEDAKGGHLIGKPFCPDWQLPIRRKVNAKGGEENG